MKRLLVTGRHGFVGATLAGMVASEPALTAWSLVEIPPAFDIRDARTVAEVVAGAAPDAVVHLAAQSFVPESFRDPAATLSINLIGTLNLLQALRQSGFAGQFVYASTGDVYGRVPEDALPVTEAWVPAPRNPYAVSKLAAEALCRQWWITEGMDIVVARAFNHIGRGQSDRFVVSDFAHQIARIRRGEHESRVHVGDIDVTRDFTDVHDVVRGYFALLERGVGGEIYNVCSGTEHSVRSILERLAALAGVDITIEHEHGRFRKAEQRRMCGDPSKMREATGWRATTPLDESLSAMLRQWDEVTA
ncbi:MAG TPA: GDP-mannose 4,6-dehydratase [Casimicrobiaceae bacterium]|nr:GDP-mannose 4,6-dehydratase [Casimicrobiaceae bacterium]